MRATYDDDLTFTVLGYSGSGNLVPILATWAVASYKLTGDGLAKASLGPLGIGSADPPLGPYVDGGVNSLDSPPIPFVFGEPFTLHLHLESFADAAQIAGPTGQYGAVSWAEFDGISRQITLASGDPAPNATVLVASATPEPSALFLVIAGTAVLALLARGNKMRPSV